MYYFTSLGRIIEGSGGLYVLTEMEAVAPGSLNNFLKGKMYNRCRRVNILLSSALHTFHFQTFMQDEKFIDELKDELRKWVPDDDDVIPESLDMMMMMMMMMMNCFCGIVD